VEKRGCHAVPMSLDLAIRSIRTEVPRLTRQTQLRSLDWEIARGAKRGPREPGVTFLVATVAGQLSRYRVILRPRAPSWSRCVLGGRFGPVFWPSGG
jgi:hypothetical protein